MKVLFLVPYPLEGASYRYRIHQFLPYLQKENISYKVSSFISQDFYKILYKKGYLLKKLFFTLLGLQRRFIDILSLYTYDVIFIHLESSPLPILLLERMAQVLKKPIIYDFDDAIFLEKENSTNILRTILKAYKKTPQRIALSSKIIVSNQYLKNISSRYIHENKISIIPTCINTDLFKPKNESNTIPVIGWLGSHSTYPYLEDILDIFPILSKQYNFILKIIGAPHKMNLPQVHCIQKDWSLKDEINDFQSFDIGIYPLANTEWVKGKAGFKAIQYMAAYIPCIASNVGVNKEIIQDGLNGFLVNTKEEWIAKISLLLSNPTLRSAMMREGRKTIERRFSLKTHAPAFVNGIKEFDLNQNHVTSI